MTQELELIKEPENEFTQEINVEKEKVKELTNVNLKEELEKLENLDEDSSDTEEIDMTQTDEPKISEVDKSFFTNSTTFSKEDFEGYEDIEKDVKKNGVFTKIAIFIIILLLIATIVLILNFILDWNLI